MNDIIRQKMIVRQSSLKLAVDLLNSEQERVKSEISIPFATIKKLTKEIEDFVWELETEDNKQINPQTGQVEVKKKLII